MVFRKNSRSKKHSKRYALLVSACLAGEDCTYKGKNNLRAWAKRLADAHVAIPICPEVMGGSSVPRPCCEISGGDGHGVIDGTAKALTISGKDVSKSLILGAKRSLALAKKHGIIGAILKSNSPSCGCGYIYDGTFGHRLVKGDGVTTALLRRNGIKVFTEKDGSHGCKSILCQDV